MVKTIEFKINIILLLLLLITFNFFCIYENKVAFAEDNDFNIMIIQEENATKYIIRNAYNYNKDRKNDISTYNFIKELGFSDSSISCMDKEDLNLLINSNYIEIIRKSYLYNERNEYNMSSSNYSNTTEYNTLYVTNILIKLSENINGNNRFVASILVEWKRPPVNRYKDLMYIVCGNGTTIGNSSYSKCYMSYYQTTYVSGIGSIGPSLIKYENGDSSNKVVPYNTFSNGESWKIDVPFTSSVNNTVTDFEFFMQSEVSIPRSQNYSTVKFGYFHQIIAGSIGVTVNSSGANVSFSPKYTMDPFTGRYYTLEYGEIV